MVASDNGLQRSHTIVVLLLWCRTEKLRTRMHSYHVACEQLVQSRIVRLMLLCYLLCCLLQLNLL